MRCYAGVTGVERRGIGERGGASRPQWQPARRRALRSPEARTASGRRSQPPRKNQLRRQGSEPRHRQDGAISHARGPKLYLVAMRSNFSARSPISILTLSPSPACSTTCRQCGGPAPVRARWRGVPQREGRARHLGRNGCVERIDLDRDELAAGWEEPADPDGRIAAVRPKLHRGRGRRLLDSVVEGGATELPLGGALSLVVLLPAAAGDAHELVARTRGECVTACGFHSQPSAQCIHGVDH